MPQQIITVGNCDPGGVGGLVAATYISYFKRKSGISLVPSFDVTFGQSVGSMLATIPKIPDPNDPTKPKYSENDYQEDFYTVASKQFGEKDIYDLRVSQVFTDFCKFAVGKARNAASGRGPDFIQNFLDTRVDPLKVKAPLFDQSILGKHLKRCLGDIRLSDLNGSHMVAAHVAEKEEEMMFGHLNDSLFDPKEWHSTDVYPDDKSVVDVILASCAAPTVFKSHTHDDKTTLIDFGTAFSLSESIRDLDKAAYHENPVFFVLCFGTGYDSTQKFCKDFYDTSGPLSNLEDISTRGTTALKKRVKRSVCRDFSGRLNRHRFDVDFGPYFEAGGLPEGIKPALNMFCGKKEYLDWMIDIVNHEAAKNYDKDRIFVDRMLDAKEKSMALNDATAAFSMPTMSLGQHSGQAKPFCVANENNDTGTPFVPAQQSFSGWSSWMNRIKGIRHNKP